jgi:hypothetical protein
MGAWAHHSRVNLPGAPPLLRAQSLSERLDSTFRLYRRHFAVFATLSLGLVVPGLVAGLLAGSYRTVFVPFSRLTASFNNPAALSSFSFGPRLNPVWIVVIYLIALVLAPLTVALLYGVTVEALLGRRVSMGSALRGAMRRYWRIWGLLGLILLAIVGFVVAFAAAAFAAGFAARSVLGSGAVVPAVLGLVALLYLAVVPVAIWLGVGISVAIPALLAEPIGPLHALKRSWGLVRGRWWRTFGNLCVFVIIQFIVMYALAALFGAVALLIPGLSDEMRGAITYTATGLASALSQPLPFIAVALMYFDLRIRREGFDLEQLAARAAASPGPATL